MDAPKAANQRPTADEPAVAKAMAGKLQIYADRIETFGVSIT
jgi:hypothetical protein